MEGAGPKLAVASTHAAFVALSREREQNSLPTKHQLVEPEMMCNM